LHVVFGQPRLSRFTAAADGRLVKEVVQNETGDVLVRFGQAIHMLAFVGRSRAASADQRPVDLPQLLERFVISGNGGAGLAS
jgi:hypothetical protein